jgi:hypothetical protein
VLNPLGVPWRMNRMSADSVTDWQEESECQDFGMLGWYESDRLCLAVIMPGKETGLCAVKALTCI